VLRAARNLRKDPLLLAAATLTLAVSIAANTTVFSIANAILVRPLPYPNSERIDWISERSGPNHDDIGAAPDYYRLRHGNRVFQEVAAFNTAAVNWTGVERPRQLDTAVVSASFFRLMDVRPMLGRYFAPNEEGSAAPPVVVLSYDFWRNWLGSDRHIVGKTIALDRLPRTIIGVMPQGFDFPRGAQMWTPMTLDEASQTTIAANRPIYTLSILARREPGVTDQQVESDLDRLALMIREEYKVFPTKFRWDLVIGAIPLQRHLTGDVRPALLMLSGAAALVLLIACVNLANLLLARAGIRTREVAIRLALGANRRRIAGQMLAESFALAVPGAAAGIVLSWLAIQLLNAAKPAILVRYPPITMDLAVLAFTFGLTAAAGVLFGMAPALSAAGTRIQDALKAAAGTHSSGRGAARLRKTLVVAELALSLMLLVGAGLLGRAFLKLAHTELGFRTENLLTFRVTPIGGPFAHDYFPFYSAVADRIKQLPMVQSAAVLMDIPLSDEDSYLSGRIRVVGRPMVPFPERPIINNTVVSPEYFRTLGIPLRSGRIFDAHDRQAGVAVTNYLMASSARVVVNEALVRKLFPGEDPLGRQLIFGPDRNSVTWTMVGVVGDIRGGSLGADPPAMIYRCTCDGSTLFRAAFALRTDGDPQAAIRAAEEQVRTVDRDQPISDVKSMDERRTAALAPERFQLILIGSFAAIAMLLAAAGVYGVMAYLVARRTREFGIRVAMGARPVDVLRIVMGETVVLAIVGIGIGLAGASAFTRYLRSMLYGIPTLDAPAFAAAAILLAAIVLLACIAPARYAARIDPTRALREE
jgi:predicted permease